MLDYVEDEYSYDHHTKYPNSSKEIDYTPSKTINRNGEMEQPGFYATQNEENNLHNNMPMYTGYLSDELEEELNYQNLRYGQVYLFKLFYHKCIFYYGKPSKMLSCILFYFSAILNMFYMKLWESILN